MIITGIVLGAALGAALGIYVGALMAMAREPGGVTVYTCPWGHTVIVAAGNGVPAGCPAKIASTADGWGQCGKVLTESATAYELQPVDAPVAADYDPE